MKPNIKQILIDRDDMTEHEADNLIQEAINAMKEYLADGNIQSAYDTCVECFGLQPDYLPEELVF